MKVLQILYSGLGGHGSVAFSLQAAASAGDHRAWRDAMIFLGIEPLLPEYEALCERRGIPHHYVRARAGAPWRSWPGLLAALRETAPDAIILHSVKTILPCWLYARARGIPLIAVEHQANALKTRSEWLASRLLMRLADAVVVLTPDYRDTLRARLGDAWREERVQVIANGIDTDAFAPADTPDGVGLGDGPVTIGMASRLAGNKRHEVLVEAMARLRDGGGDWRLTLAGDGETREAIAAQVAAAGLGDVVALPGYLGAATLRDWFGTLDIYVHATDGETLSTSILQAMAMELPIVGSDVPGVSGLLAEGGGCGTVARAQTAEAFAAAFRQVVEDPDGARAMARRARTLAVSTYSQAAMFEAYRQLLDRACRK
ncbi:MAG: glycosyltransferase family 4 protein [Caulobacter sp.]|nr:glycosyltransferase family 4 protein [Caulobacter sp.]